MAIRTWGIGLLAIAGLAIGCGDDDSGGLSGGSYDAVVGAVESPTGTVDATTTPDVVAEFDAALGAEAPTPATGTAAVVAKQTFGAEVCPEGGSATVGDASESGFTFSYDGCCVSGCCLDGRGSYYFGSGGAYATCYAFDLSTTCSGEPAVNTVYNYCLDGSGNFVYAIEVDGDTFAVSIEGSYNAGTGTLSITGENGSFTCTLTDYSGECTGTGGSFTI